MGFVVQPRPGEEVSNDGHDALQMEKMVRPRTEYDRSAQERLSRNPSVDLHGLLLPEHDPLLEQCIGEEIEGQDADSAIELESSSSGSNHEDGAEGGEWPLEDDDSIDVFFSDDPRSIDSGWGGECLREIEDIDFEFVYALHTFVATVEGQANATKGDTMVLLDDSNSYWWLVRIVKDSSIGRTCT